jgi:predicted DNA binding protein
MAVVADVSITAEQFRLGRIAAEFPTLSVEVERVVPALERVMPYLWAYGEDRDAFESALAADDAVEAVELVDELDDRALYRVEWHDAAAEFVSGIAGTDATILGARGEEEWRFRIRFEEHRGLRRFDRHCTEYDVSYRLERVARLAEAPHLVDPYELTAIQYETLRLAVERGYFRVPREVTFEELGEELDVSAQAISERVRRGTEGVLSAALFRGSGRSSSQ